MEPRAQLKQFACRPITNVLTDKSNSHAVFNAQSIIFGVPVFLVLGSIHNLPRGGGVL